MSRNQRWTEPQQDSLGDLLAQLRAVQDPLPPPPAPPSIPLTAEESQHLLLSLVNQTESTDASTSTESSSITNIPAIPSQDQLASLLTSLTQQTQSQRRDLKSLSFPESLPILQSLSTNKLFLEELSNTRTEQNEEELRLRDEKNRLKIELSKSGLSPQVQLQRLKNWDREEGLVRWKKLEEMQQLQLQEMGVPSFCSTLDPIVLARQRRVMNVLVGFLDE